LKRQKLDHDISSSHFSLILELKENFNVSKGLAKIDSSANLTLADCFEQFRKPETLSEDDSWHCNGCKSQVRATKQLSLYKTPQILVLSLNRFKNRQNFAN